MKSQGRKTTPLMKMKSHVPNTEKPKKFRKKNNSLGFSFFFKKEPSYGRFMAGEYPHDFGEGIVNLPVQIHHGMWSKVFEPKEDGSFRGGLVPCNCEGGRLFNEGNGKECVPHFLMQEQIRKGEKLNRFVSEMHAMNYIHISSKYHLVEKESQAGEKYSYATYCKPGGCQHCINAVPKTNCNYSWVDLYLKEWNMIFEFDRTIGRKCRNCENGVVVPVKGMCPECEAELQMTPSELEKVMIEDGYCHSCGFGGRFTIDLGCRVPNRLDDTYSAGCGDYKAFGIFDANTDIVRAPTTDTERQFVLSMRSHDFDFGSAEYEKIIKGWKQKDFSSLLFMDPEDQAERLGVRNPYKMDTAPGKERLVGDSSGKLAGSRPTAAGQPSKPAPEPELEPDDDLLF